MNKFIIAYIVIYKDGEMDHGVQHFNTKAAARTYERLLQRNPAVQTSMIYDGAAEDDSNDRIARIDELRRQAMAYDGIVGADE